MIVVLDDPLYEPDKTKRKTVIDWYRLVCEQRPHNPNKSIVVLVNLERIKNR